MITLQKTNSVRYQYNQKNSFCVFFHDCFNSICAISNVFSSTFLSMCQSGLVTSFGHQASSFLQITATFLALAVDIPHLSFKNYIIIIIIDVSTWS